MANCNRHDLGFTVECSIRHIRESNLPEGVKEFLTRKLFEVTTMDVQEMRGENVIPFPNRTMDQNFDRAVKKIKALGGRAFTRAQAREFVRVWGDRLPTRAFNSITEIVHDNLSALNGVEFQKLDMKTVLAHEGAGRKTWIYVQEMQDKMRV